MGSYWEGQGSWGGSLWGEMGRKGGQMGRQNGGRMVNGGRMGSESSLVCSLLYSLAVHSTMKQEGNKHTKHTILKEVDL